MNIGETLLIVLAISYEWTGIIASPGVQTGMYANLLDCEWEVKVTNGSRVKITFEMFDLEDGVMSRGSKIKQCLDYVKVIDSSGQIFYECGALAAPLEVLSSSEMVKVVFHSDESGAAKGFKAIYTGVCESNITRNALLATPNYPYLPPLGVTCSWKIDHHGAHFTIIKAVTPAKVPAGGTYLPDCGRSPLKIHTRNPPGDVSELCVQESRQAYNDNITLKYISSTGAGTWVGQLEVEFAADINCSRFCAHSSGCRSMMKLSKVEIICDCVDGYEGISCDRRKDTCLAKPCNLDRSYCVEERDQVSGSEILWLTTRGKHLDTKPCPGGVFGEATRNCVSDPEPGSGGFWTRPDLSTCVSPSMMQILRDSQTVVQNVSTVYTEHLSNITSRLVTATHLAVTSNGKWHQLFPGDLSTVVAVLEMLSQVEDVDNLEEVDNFIQEYITTVDNILDPNTTDTWRNALAVLVEAKVSKIIDSTQMLISNFLKNNRSLSGQNPTIDSGGGVDNFMNTPIFRKVVRNLDITVIRGNIKEGVYGAFTDIASTSSVVFPGLKLNTSDTSTPDVSVTIYVARFSSVSTLLSISESRFHKDSQNDSNIINSDVLSVEILGIPKTHFQHLMEPVTLTFVLQDPTLRGYYVERCVFMNVTASSYKDRWSTSGCEVAESNNTHVVCRCQHLTNFAVLMDIYNNQDNFDEGNKMMLMYISYIGGSLSILACVITIIVFHYFKLESDRIRIHQQLSLSIIFVQVMFICVGKTGKEYGTPLIGCRIVTTLLHYCLTAMFCWMLVEGTHLYIVLIRVFNGGFHFKKYLFVGWGIPLLVVGISVGAFHDKYGVGNVCWLSQELLLVCFVPAVGLVVTINTVILVLVIRVMIKSNNTAYKFQTEERSNIRLGVKAALVLLPLLGLTWILGFLAVNTGEPEVMAYAFTYLFTIANSFQGVLFFIFHCLLNVDVRQAFERRYNRKKRSSYVDTTSSRHRKMSEPEVSNDSNIQHVQCTNTNSMFSILGNLSPSASTATLPSPINGPCINMKTLDNK